MILLNLLLIFISTTTPVPTATLNRIEPYQPNHAYNTMYPTTVGRLSYIGMHKAEFIRYQTLYPDISPAYAEQLSIMSPAMIAQNPSQCIGPLDVGCSWIFDPWCLLDLDRQADLVEGDCNVQYYDSCRQGNPSLEQYNDCMAAAAITCEQAAHVWYLSMKTTCCVQDCEQ